ARPRRDSGTRPARTGAAVGRSMPLQKIGRATSRGILSVGRRARRSRRALAWKRGIASKIVPPQGATTEETKTRCSVQSGRRGGARPGGESTRPARGRRERHPPPRAPPRRGGRRQDGPRSGERGARLGGGQEARRQGSVTPAGGPAVPSGG